MRNSESLSYRIQVENHAVRFFNCADFVEKMLGKYFNTTTGLPAESSVEMLRADYQFLQQKAESVALAEASDGDVVCFGVRLASGKDRVHHLGLWTADGIVHWQNHGILTTQLDRFAQFFNWEFIGVFKAFPLQTKKITTPHIPPAEVRKEDKKI